MKKIIFAMTMLLGSATMYAKPLPEVNQKILKAFEQTFHNPQDVTWHEYDNFCEVVFNQDDIKTEVRYDNDGNVVGSTRYYFEKQLPPHIAAKLKKQYPERSVFGVTEIFTENDLSYYISMQDGKNWYTVKASPMGTFEQTEKFKKAPTN